MKLIYIANARMPTEKAHGLQIMQMLSAFSVSHYPLCHPRVGGILNGKEKIKSEIEKSIVEVELLIPKRLNGIKTDIHEFYNVKNSFKIKKLLCLDLSKLWFDGTALGFLIQTISFTMSVIFYILFKKADIIYSRDPVALMPFIFSQKKLFFEAHDASRYFFIYKTLFKRVDGIITITAGLKKFLVENGISEEKIIIAPDGADFEKFNINISKEEARKKLNIVLNKKIILYAGHLYKWKGANLLLKVASKFKIQSSLDILFAFVGGTEKDIKNFKEKAEKENLGNVFIAGRVPHGEIPLWLKAADILILPNSGKEKISSLYTSPLKMFEYMAARRPIIASNLPSIREILNDSNAIFAEADNPDSFSEAIKKILQNKELSAKIADKAYQDAQNYTWDTRAQKIVNFVLYKTLNNVKFKNQNAK